MDHVGNRPHLRNYFGFRPDELSLGNDDREREATGRLLGMVPQRKVVIRKTSSVGKSEVGIDWSMYPVPAVPRR